MPNPNLTPDERLITYKISRERYDSEAKSLRTLGFSQQEADSLIIRGSSRNTVCAVLKNYSLLLIAPYHLSHEQIVTIAGHNGGPKNLEAVKAAFTELQALSLSATQIVSIAGNIGGSKNIEAVKAAFTELQALGLSATQIVSLHTSSYLS